MRLFLSFTLFSFIFIIHGNHGTGVWDFLLFSPSLLVLFFIDTPLYLGLPWGHLVENLVVHNVPYDAATLLSGVEEGESLMHNDAEAGHVFLAASACHGLCYSEV